MSSLHIADCRLPIADLNEHFPLLHHSTTPALPGGGG
jgi:hypothetical protein